MEPLRLYVKDFYAIAEGEIDFTKFSSALILGYYENNPLMSNGAGKSSMFEAISWVIFNETRQTKVDDVIRWTANEALVEFEFIFGRSTYKISRRRSRIAKESSVSLFTKEGDKWVNDSGSTNSETNRKILALLRIDAKIFLSSVYFKQHDISLFANSTPSDRKEIIKSIMKLERWDEYQKQAKNKLRALKDDIEKQLRVLHDNANLGVASIVNEKSIGIVREEIDQFSREQKETQAKLHSLFELKRERDINHLIKLYDDINKKVVELKSTGKRLQGRQIELNDLLSAGGTKSTHLAQHIVNLEGGITQTTESLQQLSGQNTLYGELDESIFANRLEKSQLQQGLENLKNSASKVGVGQCDTCFTTITEASLMHVHDSRKQKQLELEKNLDAVIKKLSKVEAEYKTRKAAKEKLDAVLTEQQAHKNTLDKLQTQKRSIDEEMLAYENENSITSASIRAIIDQLKVYKIEVEALDRKIAAQRVSNIDDEIAEAEQLDKSVSRALTSKNIELGTLLKESEFLSQRVTAVNTANDTLIKLGKEKAGVDQLVRYFGKEGIQAVFIESIVDELEQYANETLSYICNEPTVIRLKTQKKTGDSWQETLEIDVMMNGFPQTFESLGGGEMFRISLALRIGLSEVLVKKVGGEIKLTLLDEVDSPLDAYGLNNLFENIIKGLEKRFKVLVISHNDKLKERFTDHIIVKKTSTGSFITQS
jgi:exonuclease SbcC